MKDVAALFHGSSDIAFRTDRTGRVLSASRTAEERLGYPPGGLSGVDLISLTSDGVLKAFLASPPASTSRLSAPLRLAGRDGRVHAIDAVAFAFREDEGGASGWLFAGPSLPTGAGARGGQDALLDSMGALVWAFDRAGTITTWSSECERHFGFARHEAEGQLTAERLFARPEALREALGKVDREGLYNGELSLVTAGGEPRLHEVSLRRLGEGGEGPAGYTCVAFDVADRKRSEELHRSLLEDMGEAVILVDPGTLAILDANARATEVLGYAREEFLRLRIPDLIPPGDRSRLPAVGRALEETGRCEASREPYRRKDGTVILCDHNLRLITVGGRRYVVNLLRDVTRAASDDRELREAKAFMERLQEEASDGFAIVDADGRILWVNRALARFRGARREALVGTRFLDFAAPGGEDAYVEGFRKLRAGEAVRVRALSRGRGDAERTVEISAVPLERGGRQVVFAVIRDVTEQARVREDLERRVEERTAELRRSEERFRLIAETMPVAMATTRPDGTIVYINEAGAAVLRASRESLPGRNIGDFYADPADRPKLREALFRDRGVTNWEFRLKRGDGTLGWGLTSLRMSEQDGEPSILGVFQDLSALKTAEDALRQSESRFRSAFEHMGVAACIVGPDLRFMRVNRALGELLGYAEEELLTMGFRDVTHPEDLESSAEADRRLLSGEVDSLRLEKRYRRRDGGIVWGIVTAALLRDNEGRPVHFVAGIQDITEMKRASEALRDAHDALEQRVEERTNLLSAELAQRRRTEEQLRLYREIFRHAREAVVVLDREGRLLERNEAHRKLFGGPDEEVRGRSPDFLPPDRLARLAAGVGKEGFFEEEIVLEAAEGRRVDAHLSAFVVRNSLGEVLCYVSILRDVTARRRREAALRTVLEGTTAVTGDLFFRSLVRTLCTALNAKAALVAVVLDRPATRVRTLAAWVSGNGAVDLEYDLEGTPCRDVVAGNVVVHARDVCSRFPRDPDLMTLGAQGYIGVPLTDPEGEVVGHLSVIYDREIEDEEYTTSLLRLFAGRAGTELVRRRAEEALRESEERWRSLVAHAPAIILTVDAEGRILTINRTIPGITPEQVLGRTVYEFIPESARGMVKRSLEGVLSTGLPGEYQVEGPGPDGGAAWWDTHVGPIVVQGKVVGAIFMATDITARREAERRHALVVEEQSLVLSQMRDFLYRHDEKGVFTFISPSVTQITGRTPVEWMTHYTEYLTDHPLNRKAIDFTEETLRNGAQSPPYLVEIRHKDGRRVLLEVNERAYYEEGRVVGVVGVARDVTERRRAEELLEFQKTLLESQSEAALDGILVVSMEGRMTSFNRRFLEMWRIPPAVAEARDDQAALASVLDALVDPEGFLARVRHLYDHPGEESRDEILLKDGRAFDRYSAPVRSRDGILYGRVWYFRDVTGRKRTEQELRRAAEETRRAYDDLKQAQAQLIRSEKLASIGMLVSGVAHEINNPLNVMYGNLQLLAEIAGGLAPRPGARSGVRRFRNMIRDALKAAEHARRIMDDFRGYARDARTAELVDLNRCLEEAVTLLQPEFGRRIKVVKRLGRIPSVRCFRGQMSQIFLNLLKNAVEAIDKRGTITLSTRRRGDRVIVAVADTGKGMTEELRARLFEPFFTTKEVGKGLGLGLSISAMIAHNHGGQIQVKSRPGRGSTFSLEIPVDHP